MGLRELKCTTFRGSALFPSSTETVHNAHHYASLSTAHIVSAEHLQKLIYADFKQDLSVILCLCHSNYVISAKTRKMACSVTNNLLACPFPCCSLCMLYRAQQNRLSSLTENRTRQARSQHGTVANRKGFKNSC
jgi:hypothetical protein